MIQAPAVASLRAVGAEPERLRNGIGELLDKIDQMTTPNPVLLTEEFLGCTSMRNVRVEQLHPTVWFVEFDLARRPDGPRSWRLQIEVRAESSPRVFVERCFRPLDRE
jgi:hypothetical protein